MPKGVTNDHTWPDVCGVAGALFAPQTPINVPAMIVKNRPIVLTTLELRACRAKAKEDRRGS